MTSNSLPGKLDNVIFVCTLEEEMELVDIWLGSAVLSDVKHSVTF